MGYLVVVTNLYLLLFTLLCSTYTSEHALYLSVVEITDSESSIEITVKVFRDDMVDALRNHVDSLQSTMDSLDDLEVQAYFEKHIKLYPLQDQPIQVQRISIEGESFFIDLSTDRDFDTVEQLSVSHFFELFSDQKNITKITAGEEQYFYTYKSSGQIEDITELH